MSRPLGWVGTPREQYAAEFDRLRGAADCRRERIAAVVRQLVADPRFIDLPAECAGSNEPGFFARLKKRYMAELGGPAIASLPEGTSELAAAQVRLARNPDYAPLIAGGAV